MPRIYKIGFLFSDTGGGHRSAADAIAAGINELVNSEPFGDSFCVYSDNVVENTHPINRAFVDFYNYLLRHNQQYMKYYYQLIHAIKPNDSETGYRLVRDYLAKSFEKHQPDVIVSVHPMSNHYVARAMRETGWDQRAKFVIVVTDPNGEFWRGWACPDADLTLVPNDLGYDQLLAWGVHPNKIRVVGMPVNPEFLKAPSVSKEEFRRHLGLYKDRTTVCINAGWAGGGNMLAIYRQLSKVSKPIQAVFLCGHNRSLYERIKREVRHSVIPTAVLPFHDRMADLMSAVDLMVTKAGGLTTFEAIARKLPMAIDMITKPMPQEAGTVKIVVEQNLAQTITRPEDVVSIIEDLSVPTDRSSVKLPDAHSLDKIDAVYDIARAIVSFCEPRYAPVQPQVEHT